MDPQVRFVTGEIEAGSLREVSSELEKLGYVAARYRDRQATRAAKPSFFSLRRPVGRREITVFLRELSLVLRAGLTLDDALLLLAGEESARARQCRARPARRDYRRRELRRRAASAIRACSAPTSSPWCGSPKRPATSTVFSRSVGEERARTERLMDKVSSVAALSGGAADCRARRAGVLPGCRWCRNSPRCCAISASRRKASSARCWRHPTSSSPTAARSPPFSPSCWPGF